MARHYPRHLFWLPKVTSNNVGLQSGGIQRIRISNQNREAGVRLSTPLLAAADLAAFLIFAIGGRLMHSGGHPVDLLGHVPRVVAPFLIGWCAAAVLFGAYPRAGEVRLGQFAVRSLLAVLVGDAIGFAIRAYALGEGVSLPFVVTALAFTAVVVVGARLLIFKSASTRTTKQPLLDSG